MTDSIEEKYIVFNKAKFDLWMGDAERRGYLPPIENVNDAVVIREQDIFAGPAFEMYAAAITTALRLLPREDDTVTRLTQIRNYFRRCADRAYEKPSKVPD